MDNIGETKILVKNTGYIYIQVESKKACVLCVLPSFYVLVLFIARYNTEANTKQDKF